MLEKVIRAISPEWGLRRAGARAMLNQYDTAQRYAAGGMGRRNKGWHGRTTSANSEIGRYLSLVQNRANEFARDHWAGRRILDVLVSHVVGDGIRTVVDTGSDRRNRLVSNYLEEWAERADIEGVLTWQGLQALAVRCCAEGGNSMLRHYPIELADAGRTIPFRLQGLEGAQIDTTKDGVVDGYKSRLGVGLGPQGQRRGMWLYEDHPAEMRLGSNLSHYIDWNDLCHLYRPDRFGQVLGISWFAQILLPAKELEDLREAVAVRERTQACFAAFRHRSPGGANPLAAQTKAAEDGQDITRIEPGMILDIGESDISFASPSGNSSFEPIYKTGLHAMAAGAGITYDQLTGDLSGANYSSLRAGKIEFRRMVKQIQNLMLVPMVVAPVMRKAIMYGELAGHFKIPKAGYSVNHIMPAIEPIDPKKDLEADIAAVRAGAMSPQEFITAWGRPWQEVVEDTAKFFQYLDSQENGIVLDIDARRPRNGATNYDPTSSKSA